MRKYGVTLRLVDEFTETGLQGIVKLHLVFRPNPGESHKAGY